MEELFKFVFSKLSHDSVREELKSIVLFEECTKKELQTVLKVSSLRSFKKDEHVFFEKDPGSAVYVIMKGKVAIVQHVNGKSRVLTELSKGMFFGEIALFDEYPRSATARVTEDAVMLCLFKQDLQKISNQSPVLGNKLLMALAKVLAQRLRLTTERLKEQSK